MIDREKGIKGLECHAVPGGNCLECPYGKYGVDENGLECENRMAADALELLKAQEPRVLTLEEVRNEYKVVWLETKYLSSKTSIVDNEESNADWLWLVFGLNDNYKLSCRSYGKRWRCWSSKPTDEQREAVKWE